MKRPVLTALVLTLTLLLCSCVSPKPKRSSSDTQTAAASAESSAEKSQNPEVSQNVKASETEETSVNPNTAEMKAEEIMSGRLIHKSYNIDVDFINQNPELPTGCESVSLAMAFNALGYPTSKTELADNYMPIGGSYVTTFFGDPHENDGTGIYPPGLVQTAQN